MSHFATEVTCIRTAAASPDRLLGSVSISLAEGEQLGVVGASGSGKSLLLAALVGLLPRPLRAEGHLLLRGRRYDLGEPAKLAVIRRGGLGLLSQSAASSLDPTRRIEAQLAEVEERCGSGSSTQSRSASLSKVGLDPSIGRAFPHQLSGGEAQRTALALALAGRPEVLLADEPTANLDTVNGALVLAALDRAAAQSGLSLILVSHDLAEVASRCPRLLVLDRGRAVESGRASDLLREPQAAATRRLVDVARHREQELAVSLGGGHR